MACPLKWLFSYWKASEQKNWCFYFFIPVLSGILPDDYLEHYKYLVKPTVWQSRQSPPWPIIEVKYDLARLSTWMGDRAFSCKTWCDRLGVNFPFTSRAGGAEYYSFGV